MTSRERNMVIFLAVVAVGALAYLFLVVLGGDEEAPQPAAPTLATTPPPIDATPGTGVGEPGAEPPRAVTFFGGRDPFVPLIVEPTAAASPGTEGTTDGTTGETTGGTTGGTTGETTGGTGTGESPPPPGGEGGGQISVTGREVVLVDVIDDDSAQVEVDGDTFTVSEGETFSHNFELVSVDGSCARFLFGDESFTLCEGEPQK